MEQQAGARGRKRWIEAGAVVLVLVALVGIAAWLRLWRLGEIPPFMHFDEGNNGADALSVLAGNRAVFFSANRGREGLIMYAVAAWTALLGPSMLAARLTGALCSTFAVAATCWLGSVIWAGPPAGNWVERNRGWIAGAIGGGIMAAALGLAIIGRTGLRANFQPLLFPIILALLWTGLPKHSTWRIVLAGALTGLLAYTYISARLFPLLLVLLALTLLLPWAARGRALVRAYWRDVLVFGLVALVVATPIILHFVRNPADFNTRNAEVWLFTSQLYDGNPITTLLKNVGLQLSVLGFAGDPSWRSNYDSLPLLNPVEAVLFWLGLGVLAWQWRRPASRLILLWLAIFLVPAVLSYDLPRNTFRMLALFPAIYLTAGYGAWSVASWLNRWARGWRPGGRLALNSVLAVGAAALIVGQAWQSGRILYDRWAVEMETHLAAPNVEWMDIMRLAAAQPASAGQVFVVPTSKVGEYATSSFAYLYRGDTPVHFYRTDEPGFAAALGEQLRQDHAAHPIQAVNTIHWDREAVADAARRIPFLLNKYGRPLDGEDRQYYRLDRYGDLLLDRPWTLYDRLEPRAVALDGGISLAGLALGTHGGQQVDTQATLPVTVAQDDPLWLALRWQADQPPKANYRLSLRLFDAAGNQVWQQDGGLVDDLNRPTGQWQPGQAAESFHTLALPGDLTPGDYELRLIVYDETTLTPTVQVGVWTPELPLARLRIEG